MLLIAAATACSAGSLCGGEVKIEPTPSRPVVFVTPFPVPPSDWHSPPTATPIPTFTLVPTPKPEPSPTLFPFIRDTLIGELVALPEKDVAVSPTSLPTLVPDNDTSGKSTPVSGTPQPTVTATLIPSLTLVPQIDTGLPNSGNAELLHHTFFPVISPEIPDYLVNFQDISSLPQPYSFITPSARTAHWLILYDVSQVSPDWKRNCYVRWYETLPNQGEHLMIENTCNLDGDGDVAVIWSGIGDPQGGFWKFGSYRVALLDHELNEILDWSFDVR